MTAIFPPLLTGAPVTGDPLSEAVKMATAGCDAGLVFYNLDSGDLRAAIVFAPEVPLQDAVAMLPACGIAFQNALGSVAPPEVAVHLEWNGDIRINGGRCGGFQMRASDADPTAVPDWLIIGLHVPFLPTSDNPGETPDDTCLYGEGCAEVEVLPLLESWARHMLVWINTWSEDGTKPLHDEWRGLAYGLGEGAFVGVDECFGMLRKSGETTTLIPLTSLLEPT